MSLLSPANHFVATRDLFALLTRHRQLTWEMAKRELTDRYLGQVFGFLWMVGHPILLMLVYLFIFAVVFRVKLQRTDGLPMDYSLYLLAGLIPWLAFNESMAKGTVAISSNASLVKQVVFPVEVLPVKGVLGTLFTPLVSLVVLSAYCLVRFQMLPWTWLLLPVLLFLQALGMAGVSFALASAGAYFRDLKDIVQVFGVVGVYLVPAFYLPDMIPGVFRPFIYANPFSYMVWCYQDVCYYGRFEHPWAWLVFPVLCLGTFYAGYRVFRKLRIFFGNVL